MASKMALFALTVCIFGALASAFPQQRYQSFPGVQVGLPPYRPVQIPTPPCFRQPCNLPAGFRHPRGVTAEDYAPEDAFLEEYAPEEYALVPRFRRGVDDKGFKDFSQHANTRLGVHGQARFGANADGALHSTAKAEHDLWKSQDGNSRLTAFGRYDRVDGGRMDGFNDKKFGLKYSIGF